MKIKVTKDEASRWFWYIIAKNNKILAVSDTYETKRTCVQTAERVAWSKPMDVVIEES